MGGFDIYCIICGNPQQNASSQLSGNTPELKEFIKKTKYMDNIIFLTHDNKIIFDCYDASDCGCFMTEESESEIEYRIPSQCSGTSTKIPGIPIHSDCWNFIKEKYLLELKYSDINPDVSTRFSGNYKIVNDEINQYQSRYMKFQDILENDVQELCYSPLDNLTNKNEKRIQNRLKEQLVQFKEHKF